MTSLLLIGLVLLEPLRLTELTCSGHLLLLLLRAAPFLFLELCIADFPMLLPITPILSSIEVIAPATSIIACCVYLALFSS